MSETSFRKFYRRAEFVALTTADINLPLLQAELGALVLAAPFVDVTLLALGAGIAVEWDSLPIAADVALVTAAIVAHVGAATTSEPFVLTSDPATTTTGAAAVKLTLTTPPLDAGTYQVIFSCQYRMTAVVAGEAARAISTVNGVTQQDHWGESVVKAYNGAATIKRTAGQIITAELSIQEVGPGAGTAEMSKARITVDKIG